MVFDPYHNWLGIPPREQPANHYRLLGIDVFEPNGDVICHAADRQMAHLRTFQTSKHAAESQRLLNEVAAARHCLLDPTRRAAYDAALRVRLAELAVSQGTAGFLPPVPAAPFPASPLPPPPTPNPAPAPYPPPYPTSQPAPYQDISPSPPGTAPAHGGPVPPMPVQPMPAQQMPVPQMPAQQEPAQMPVVRPVPIATSPVPFTAGSAVHPVHPVRTRRRKDPITELFKIGLGGLVGCATALAILWYAFRIDPIGWRGLVDADSPQVAANNATGGSDVSKTPREPESGRTSPSTRHPNAVHSGTPAEKPTTNDPTAGAGNGGKAQAGDRSSDSKPEGDDFSELPTPATASPPKKSNNVADPFEPAVRNRPRVAVPSQDAQASTLAVLEDLYKLSAMRLRADKQQLAQKLLAASDEGTASDAERFVLLRKAAESAADAGDAPLVKRALDKLGESFEFDFANAKEKLLLRTIENVRDESAMDDLVSTSRKVVLEFISQDRMDEALRLTEATYTACLKPVGKRHRKFVYDGQAAIRKLHQLWAQSEEAREAIDRGAGTAEHHRLLGRFLCLQRGEWDQGLPHLAQTEDAALRAVAERDLSRPTDSSLRVQLADSWYEVAKSSAIDEGFAVRAAHWYELALNEVTGLNKAKVTMRLEEMRNMVRDVDQREPSAAALARQAKQ